MKVDLLRYYRTAHARVSSIEAFETSLRENTPLTSISDPGALVEYLNQLNLKGDMVLDELKRVSSERDNIKEKFKEAEKSTQEAWDKVTELREQQKVNGNADQTSDIPNAQPVSYGSSENNVSSRQPSEQTSEPAVKSPPNSIKLGSSSIPSISLFSPKTKPSVESKVEEDAEEFFSYDSELPRLESELNEKQGQVVELQNEVKILKSDLAVARESTQSMVKTLEDATREVNLLKEQGDKNEADIKERKIASDILVDNLKAELEVANRKLREAETQQSTQNTEQISSLKQQLYEATSELDSLVKSKSEKSDTVAVVERLQSEIHSLEADISKIQTERDNGNKRIDTLSGLVSTLREQLAKAEHRNEQIIVEQATLKNALAVAIAKQEQTEKNDEVAVNAARGNTNTAPSADVSASSKKRNKKKKKGFQTAAPQDAKLHANITGLAPAEKDSRSMTPEFELPSLETSTASTIQTELSHLRVLLEEKDAAIDRLHGKLKNEEEMQEEIDSLRDDLVNVGQEHVEAKDRMKDLLIEKAALQETVTNLEEEVRGLNIAHDSKFASEQAQKDLVAQFDDLKVKATNLQTDLSVAQQLASSRFKDLTDLRSLLQKAQPELVILRKETTELKSVNEELTTKLNDLQRMEKRHEIIRTELDEMKKSAFDKDSEIKILNQKFDQESITRLKAEEASSKARQDFQLSETEKRQFSQSLEKVSKDLAKSREELNVSKARVHELEDSVSKFVRDSENLKEEIELKTAQHASAESLMSSMRDQSTEMAIQAKEARERCENLEEEVADAHRLLTERSREGETMRRLLSEVEGRIDSRIREMKERMDNAVEERDRAEDEASTIGRRRTRELEEVRNRLKDIERSLKRSEEDKEELETAQRDWKRRREELEQRAEQSVRELDQVKKAMSELRDALDESERQARDLEKQKAELRRTVEDTQQRLDKLQKSNKVRSVIYLPFCLVTNQHAKSMAEEVRLMQATKAKQSDSEVPSTRSSIDLAPSRAKLGSPVPKSRSSSAAINDTQNGQSLGSMDYVYLKNILLQFLEQKDKKHQLQLIPVLGMLLHFDRCVVHL